MSIVGSSALVVFSCYSHHSWQNLTSPFFTCCNILNQKQSLASKTKSLIKSILQDGTIGSELVIRPLPVKHRKLQQKSAGVQLQSGSHDDEMFMDEEDFRSADFMTPSPPSTLPPASDTENALIRKKRSLYDLKHSVGSHVVYKRAAIQSDDDYGMCFFVSILMLFPFIVMSSIEIFNER
jgi:hypothetical protein